MTGRTELVTEMNATKKLTHAADARARRDALTEAILDLELSDERLADAQDTANDLESRKGQAGAVHPDELVRVRARLEIAEAEHGRAKELVKYCRHRLLNESTVVADALVDVVRALVPGISTVIVVPHEPVQPAGPLPVAACVQLREAVQHPSGYVFTHASNYGGSSAVSIVLWTTTRLHAVPTVDQVARLCRAAAQVSTGSRATNGVTMSSTTTGDVTRTTYTLKIVGAWDRVPAIDLSSPWYSELTEMSVPVRGALEAPGLQNTTTHSSVHSRVISSSVVDSQRATRVELKLSGATSAWSPETTAGVLVRLAERQVGRCHQWLGRCRTVEITSSKAVDSQGQLLSAQLGGEAAGALITATLEFDARMPTW